MNEVLEKEQSTFTLTEDQQTALEAFQDFLMDTSQQVFVLRGFSGCGKSTLVKHLLELYPKMIQAVRLINPDVLAYTVELTATTNKAAENLSFITGSHAKTIHSFLNLRVKTLDYRTKETTLVRAPNAQDLRGYLLFVDEASYIDRSLLRIILSSVKDSKIVFIGDPAQLTPVKSQGTPVFEAAYPGAALTQVVRQASGNPIVALSTMFREVVTSGKFFQFSPDGHHIVHMDRDSFDEKIKEEFLRSDWKFRDSKILAWTNGRVVAYNNAVQALVKGDPSFQKGDYAICNHYIGSGSNALKTDEMVQITDISFDATHHGIPGRWVRINNIKTFFLPDHYSDRVAREKQAIKDEDEDVLRDIGNTVIDLRAAYACTINKAQGSTFDTVFIDLDDIRRCNSGDQIARMLYVAVSRARHHVYFTGDLA